MSGGAVMKKKKAIGPPPLYLALFNTASLIGFGTYTPDVGPKIVVDRSYGPSYVISGGASSANVHPSGYLYSQNGYGGFVDLSPYVKRKGIFTIGDVTASSIYVFGTRAGTSGYPIGFVVKGSGVVEIINRSGAVNVTSTITPVEGDIITCTDDGTSNADAFKMYKNGALVLTSNLVDAGRQTRVGINVIGASAKMLDMRVEPLP